MNPFFPALCAFIFGLYIAQYLGIPWLQTWYILAFFSLVVFSLLFHWRKKAWLASIGILGLIALFAIFRYQQDFYPPQDHPKIGRESLFKGRVLENLSASEKNYKCFVHVEAQMVEGVWQKTSAKFLLYISKNLEEPVRTEQILFRAKPEQPPQAKNPHQFDYALYLRRKAVFTQAFVHKMIISEKQGFLAAFFRKKRFWAKQIEEVYAPVVSLFSRVLILADKSDFQQNDRTTYAKAGIAHLFAVSGLHTVIVFGFFWFLFAPFRRIEPKYLRTILSLLAVLLFAAFVGFQASVSRACFMLFLFTISKLIGRPLSLNDTLITSAFFLLLIRPLWLWDVGFQLSFSAVYFIGLSVQLLNPALRRMKPLLRNFLNLGGVSFAAQVGTAPWTIFYFHQFSLFALFLNVLILPFVSIILILCFLVVLSAVLHFFPDGWVLSINYLFENLQALIEWVAKQQPERLSRLFWTWPMVLVSLLFLDFSFRYLKTGRRWYFAFMLLFLLAFQGFRFYDVYAKSKTEELVFFKNNNYDASSLILWRKGSRADIFYADSAKLSQYKKYILEPYFIAERIQETDFHLLAGSPKKLSPQCLVIGSTKICINTTEPNALSYAQNKSRGLFIDKNGKSYVIGDKAAVFDLDNL